MDIQKLIDSFDNYPTEVTDYRLIPDFGWHVVTYTRAKDLGMQHYSTFTSMCAKGHLAPMSVEKAKCIKCLAIEARNKGVQMTDAESFEFWRRKLKLPRIENPGKNRCVFVVENMPYTKMADAVRMSGVPEGIIHRRCGEESFPDYQKIPTRFVSRQSHVYKCGNNEYTTMKKAAEGEGIHFYVVANRVCSSKWPDWVKIKVMQSL